MLNIILVVAICHLIECIGPLNALDPPLNALKLLSPSCQFSFKIIIIILIHVNFDLKSIKRSPNVLNTYRGGDEVDDSDDEGGAAPSRSRKKPKKKQVPQSEEGLSAKQRRKVVSKATISDTDSSDDGGDNTGTGQNTASARLVFIQSTLYTTY